MAGEGESSVTHDMRDGGAPVPLLLAGVATGQSRGSYLLGTLLILGGMILLGVAIFMGVGAIASHVSGSPYLSSFGLLLTNATAIPVLALLMRPLFGMGLMDLIAPGRRFDTGMLIRSATIFALPVLATILYGLISGELVRSQVAWRTFLIWLPATIILFALQSAAEELLFRGYLAQGMQVMLGRTIVTVLSTALLFTLAHEGSDIRAVWAQRADIMVTALFLSWTTLRFGRLEAAMGVHIANNILFACFFGGAAGGVLDFPGLTERVDSDPADFEGVMDVLEFAATQAAAIGFYWLAGVRTGFIEKGSAARQA